MAVRLKSNALLECTASSLLRNNLLAVEAATSPSPSPTLFSRPPATLLKRGRESTDHNTTTLQRQQRGGREGGRPHLRNGCKYIVNPSRYPPSYLRAISQASLPRDTLTPTSEANLRANRAWYAVNDHRVSPPRKESPFPSPLPSIAVPYRRIPLQSDHLSLPSPFSPEEQSLPVTLDPTVAILCVNSPPSLDIAHTSSASPSPSPSPSPPQSPLDKPTPSQLAFVLLKLREEMPVFFEGHHSLDMYAPDLLFESSLGPQSWTIQGSGAYSALLAMWRLSVKTFFSQPQLDLLKISKDLDAGKIEARWRARGKPRVPWSTGERVIIEAFSTFSVNLDGNISAHKVDKVMPGGKERNWVMSWLAQVGVAFRVTASPQHSMEPR